MALSALTLSAQTDSVTNHLSTYQIGLGPTRVLDTYLSQEKFSGVGMTFLNTLEIQKPDSRWTTMTQHQFNFSTVCDRSESRDELQGDYSLFTICAIEFFIVDTQPSETPSAFLL